MRRGSRLSRRRRRGEEERRGGEEQATDIKSNNPHLAGGEKTKKRITFYVYIYIYIHVNIYIYTYTYIYIYLHSVICSHLSIWMSLM